MPLDDFKKKKEASESLLSVASLVGLSADINCGIPYSPYGSQNNLF
jgi:hypothetical protein